jgi:hypothetical protein
MVAVVQGRSGPPLFLLTKLEKNAQISGAAHWLDLLSTMKAWKRASVAVRVSIVRADCRIAPQ